MCIEVTVVRFTKLECCMSSALAILHHTEGAMLHDYEFQSAAEQWRVRGQSRIRFTNMDACCCDSVRHVNFSQYRDSLRLDMIFLQSAARWLGLETHGILLNAWSYPGEKSIFVYQAEFQLYHHQI